MLINLFCFHHILSGINGLTQLSVHVSLDGHNMPLTFPLFNTNNFDSKTTCLIMSFVNPLR